MKRISLLICLPFLAVAMVMAADKPFVVVIDAGHGGKDPGASGFVLKLKEKDINLKTALKLGDLLSKEKNVKVLYTRKKDVFIPLDDRAQIANKAKADLFISIHVNAAENRSARGTESYAVGSSSANLEVAKRENAVMLYESDYKTKYRGFDPNSTESYIMFDFLQSKYMEQSVSFASHVEDNFTKMGRSSRGVKQAGFWVLKQAAMPAVLVELGYISNKEEEAFLAKDKNLDKLAGAIAKAFVQYKNKRDKRNTDGYKDVDSKTKKEEPHLTSRQSLPRTPWWITRPNRLHRRWCRNPLRTTRNSNLRPMRRLLKSISPCSSVAQVHLNHSIAGISSHACRRRSSSRRARSNISMSMDVPQLSKRA